MNKNLHLNTKLCVYPSVCITTLLHSGEAGATDRRHSKPPRNPLVWPRAAPWGPPEDPGVWPRDLRGAADVLRPQALGTNCAHLVSSLANIRAWLLAVWWRGDGLESRAVMHEDECLSKTVLRLNFINRT